MAVGTVHQLGLLISVLLIVSLTGCCLWAKRIRTNQWLVRLQTHSGEQNRDDFRRIAKRIAEETGFKTWLDDRDEIFKPNEFLFLHHHPHPRKGPHEALLGHPSVESAQQLRGYSRTKRGFKPSRESPAIMPEKRAAATSTSRQADMVRVLSSDPLFGKEWYIHNTGQAEGTPGLDLNVLSAWEQNITGRGVITAIMDDGIDYLHPDIAPNYAAEASYDFSGNDPHPYPR